MSLVFGGPRERAERGETARQRVLKAVWPAWAPSTLSVSRQLLYDAAVDEVPLLNLTHQAADLQAASSLCAS